MDSEKEKQAKSVQNKNYYETNKEYFKTYYQKNKKRIKANALRRYNNMTLEEKEKLKTVRRLHRGAKANDVE